MFKEKRSHSKSYDRYIEKYLYEKSKKEIEKEKEVVIDEINSYKDSPLDRLMDEFDRIFFGDHPLGNPILGTKKSVKRFKREDLLAFIQSNFTFHNII